MRNAQVIEQMDPRFDFTSGSAQSRSAEDNGPHIETGLHAWATEEALMLVQRLFAVQEAGAPKVVLFADIDQADNSGRMAASVAETLARTSSRATCLVDADLRSPVLSSMLGVRESEGLTDALSNNAPIRSFVRPMSHPQLWFLSGGTAIRNSASLLASDRFRSRLAELRDNFDYVIVNAAPLSRYADAMAIGQQTDGLVLTLKAGSTRREAAQIAATNLRAARIPILGAVLTERTFPIPEKIYRKL